MQLYSGLLSPFSAKVRIALAEKGLACEILEIPWSRRNLWGPKPPEFLAVSPKGEVPVLLDGDVTVVDSTVILEYLEDTQPAPALYPAEPAERARCRQLEAAADDLLAGPVTALVQEVFTKTQDAERDAARIAEGRAGVERAYGRLEKALADRGGYLCDGFSVADIAAFIAVGFAAQLGSPPGDAHPRLTAWLARVGARPSVGGEFAAMTQAAAEV